MRIRRLDRIYVRDPVYFITICTRDRVKVLANAAVVEVLRGEWEAASDRHGWLVGRYVVMPDHVHFFCAECPENRRRNLSVFVGKWKEWTSKKLRGEVGLAVGVWQKGFFDHVLRSGESYAEKWGYVRENPVRAGLVKDWRDWPYQGYVWFDNPLW